MGLIVRITGLTLSIIFFCVPLQSQPGRAGTDGDSAGYKWNVSSKKTGEGEYELIFSVPGVDGWQLYSPSQAIPDLLTAELKFDDSTISQQDGFTENGISKQVASTVF